MKIHVGPHLFEEDWPICLRCGASWNAAATDFWGKRSVYFARYPRCLPWWRHPIRRWKREVALRRGFW